MRVRTIWMMLVAGALLLGACGSDSGGGSSSELTLDGREFWSTAVTENGAPRDLVEGTRIALRFNGTQIGVSAGCNSIGGEFDLDGDRLTATELFQTEMGCDPARHAQDEFVIAVLAAGPIVTTAGDTLTLETDTTRIDFLDTKVANPDRPIVGTSWTVDGFEDGQAAFAFGIERAATFEFADDSTLAGFDGCGDFFANVEVADGSTGGPVEGDGELQFGPVEWRDASECDAPVEYLDALRRVFDAGQASYTIDGTSLRIVTREGFGLTARAS